MLSIKGVSKAYAKSSVKAVDSLTLELKSGEIFGFLGENGAGKTTTIKMVTGILTIDSGSISVCGHDIQNDPLNAKMNFGYVNDSHVTFDKLTGRQYVNFLADIYGVDADTRKKRVDDLLERFDLTKSYDAQISSYSHGMQQKIAIIGALIHDPKLWILDEPMTGLDPHSSFQLKELMREHCSKGNTVFFSTHILDVAEKLCDRIGIIKKGKLLGTGTMEEIKQMSNDKSLEEFFLSVTDDNITMKDML